MDKKRNVCGGVGRDYEPNSFDGPIQVVVAVATPPAPHEHSNIVILPKGPHNTRVDMGKGMG